ncbi:MAG: hypothetical protein SGBAC_004424 [Bacillariaceae sp.]
MIEGPVFLQPSSMTQHFRPVSPETQPHTPSLKLNELSMKEREMALQDLHGVSDIPYEDEAFVQSALRELREELQLQESFGADDQELIKFLRAESFDTLRAAARWNRFAASQKKLFGNQDIIKHSDLFAEDMKYLQSGFMQLLPQRDRAGRAIILCLGALKQQLKTPVETDLRCLSFLVSKAAKDEDTQKRGIVVIYYGLAQKTYDGRNNGPVHWIRAFGDLPARVVATHFCYDNAAMKPLLNLVSDHMEPKMLCRFRSHCGQHGECQDSLKTFGIPMECLPVDVTGQVDLTNHTMLLKTIEFEEQHSTMQDQLMAQAATTIGMKFLIPSQMDIILGRGQHAKNTPGHIRFIQLLVNYQARYEAAEKSQKTGIADLILKELKLDGCRFLKPLAGGGWLQVTDEAGREKINHAFRNLRRTTAKKATTSSRVSSASSSPSKKRRLDNMVESWCMPSDALTPIPFLATSTSPVTKKRALDSIFDSGFPFNLLSKDFSETKAFAL